MAVLAAVGGSTNAIIHLCAVAGRRGLILPPRRFAEVSAQVPVMVDLAPVGTGLMPDLAAAGGVPAVLAASLRSWTSLFLRRRALCRS